MLEMKIQLILKGALITACIASPTGAAESRHSDGSRVESVQPSLEPAGRSNRMDRLGLVEKSSVLIGTEVRNYQGEKLGNLSELAIDVESGRVVNAIVSIGGFLGVGDTLIAIPPGALHPDPTHKIIQLDADKAKLKAAPAFELSKWTESFESNRVSELYRYYGQQPYFRWRDGTNAPNTVENRNRKENANRSVYPPQSSNWSTRLGHVSRATKLVGMPVNNRQSEKLGKVDALLVDLQAGRVVAVILSSGGFLGLGDELSAVPPAALSYNSERDGLILDASMDFLARAPHFKANQWPDVGEPTYAEGVYRAYHVEPYFTTNSRDADNTARNVRDRDSRTLTPLDQSNSAADVDTTSRIRKEILALSGISVSARNVKVITANGRVTLRGPVNSEEEKRQIGEVARKVATTDNVDNQLEVKGGRN